MRAESFASPIPPGAGRFNDFLYPDKTVVGAAAQNGAVRARATGSIVGFGTLQNLGHLTTSANLFYQGVNACTQNNGIAAAGTGGCVSFNNIMNVPIRTGPRPAYWPLDDDFNVCRVVHIGCIGAAQPTSADDYGLQLISNGSNSAGIARTPALGFGFQFTNNGLSFRANNGGGVVDTVLATNGVGGYQNTDYHSMEFRILSAMSNADATLKIILDDVLIQTILWTGGTLPSALGAAAVSFFLSLWTNAASATNTALVTHFLGVQFAPSELMVL